MKLHLPKGLLVAVLAACSPAQMYAASFAPTDDASSTTGDLLWAYSSSSEGKYTNNLPTGASVSSFKENSNGTITATDNFHARINDINSKSTAGFTISFDLLAHEKQNWENVLAVGTNENKQEAQLQKSSDGRLMIYANNFGGGSTTGEYSLGQLDSLVGSTITLTFDGSTLIGYVDGIRVTSLSYAFEANATKYAGLSDVAFAHSSVQGGRWGSSTYDNIGVWDSAMTAVEVATQAGAYTLELSGTVDSKEAAWKHANQAADFSSMDSNSTLAIFGASSGDTLNLSEELSVKVLGAYGNVTIQGENVNAANLYVTEGATLTVGADTTANTITAAGSSELTVASGTTLRASFFNLNSTADITVQKEGVLDVSKVLLPDDASSAYDKGITGLINQTSGDGTVILASSSYINSGSRKIQLTFDTNYVVGSDSNAYFSLNSHWNEGSWITHTVTQDGSITVGNGTGRLEILSGQKLTIDGGSVTVGTLAIGHSSTAGVYSGAIEMTSGQLTTGTIYAQNKGSDTWKNEIKLTGGTLKITGDTALTYASTARTTAIIGGSGEGYLILQTGDKDWSMSKGNTAGNTLEIGNITIDADNTKMITINDAILSGTIVNNATAEGAGLTLSGAFSASENLITRSSSTNGFGHTATITLNLKGDGNYVFANGMTIQGIAMSDFAQSGSTYTASYTGVGTIYYVADAPFTIDGSENNAAKNATGYHVNKGQTLTVEADQSTTMTAGKILSEATGEGNIKLTTDATMTGAASVEGKLTVDGATLTVDQGGVGPNTADTNNTYLSSFTSIDLNNATINYQGDKTTWKNVKVGTDGATLVIRDMGEYPNDTVDMITFDGTTTLNGDFLIKSDTFGTYTNSWKFGVNIKALTGEGNLTVVSSATADPTEISRVNVKLQDTYKGILSLTHDRGAATELNVSADGDINLAGLSVSGGANANVDLSGVAGTKNLGTVKVGANTTLNLQGTVGNMAATGDGVISLADGTSFTGTASIANGMTLAGTITNSGNLTLTGALNAASLDVFDGSQAYVGDVEGNGYLSAAYTIVQASGNNSQLTANGLTLTIAGTSYDLSKVGNDLKYVASGNGGTYYVNTTQDYAVGSKIASDATTGITMNGGTLNLNTALADKVAISTAKAGSVINVAGGVTLSQGSVVAGNTKSTITGGSTAVYDMGAAVTLNVNLSSEWMGTVVISNANYDETGIRLNSLGNANSKVKLMGINGWFDVWDGTGYDFAPDIELENYVAVGVTKSALIVSDNSNGTYNFQGSISGTGDIQLASKGNNTTSGMRFSGDTSQWTGGLLLTNAYNGDSITSPWTVSFTGGGDIFSAEGNKGIVMNRASNADGNENILSLNIGNADKASTMNGAISMGENADENAQLKLTVTGDTTFKKGVEVTSLTVDAGKTATLEGTTTTGSLTTNGTVKVTGSGSLTYGGNTTVTAPAAQTFAMETPGATITNNAITGGNVAFSGTESITESRIISDSSIVNNATGKATINVGAENLSLYAVSGDIELKTLESGASIGIVTVAAGKNISSVGNLTVEDSLTLNGSAALSVTGDLDLSNASALTLNGAEASNWANVTGMFTMSTGMLTLGGDILSKLATLESGSQLDVFSVGSFTLGGQAISDLTYESGYTLDQVFVGASSDYYLGYTANADGTGGIVYIGVIPEPTTATLSLMALAALAARRRRRASR